jgi:outer membrane protein OmpA-like peptidoglycan-associated protein
MNKTIFLIIFLASSLVAKAQFMIELGVYHEQMATEYFGVTQLPVTELKNQNGYFHYRVGPFVTFLEAEIKLLDIQSGPFEHAKIIDLEVEMLMLQNVYPFEVESIPGAITTIFILFEGKTKTLTESAKDYLNQIGKNLKSSNELGVSLIGHTDSEGSAVANDALSGDRVREIRDHLRRTFGIADNRIWGIGSGESRPLLQNNTEFGVPIPSNRRLNNRVTVTYHPFLR